jgi:hypothetical protein
VGNNNKRGGCRARNQWNNAAGGTQTGNKFRSRNKDIAEDLVFDNTGPNNAANFQNSLKGIANYLHTTYCADVSDAVRKMEAVVIEIPEPPEPKQDAEGNDIPISSIQEYKWKESYKDQSARKNLYDESMPKAFIHIYNQCSNNLKNDLEASAAYPTIKSNTDLTGLLKLIQGLCCSYDSKTQSVMATIASHKHLYTYFQRDGVDNSTYHREFMAHIKTIETYGGTGAVGITPTFIAQRLKQIETEWKCLDPDSPSDAELTAARKYVREEFLAALMLSGANRDRYAALQTELANQYGFGNDLYPKTVDQCLKMMNRRMDTPVRPQQQQQQRDPQPKQEEEALVFAQGSDKKGSKT